ncbi:hypothetical protein M2447_001293 [Ereboglobus sp. PH5-10]|uniref:FAD-dependent oxidoreductase n=1 Tax=Ereboglobus sp. PH5-10 TaxID=2940629 RepID=UPI002404C175|nr:FAD-dependent oxidoreductase [Ereboglobus sp. PH5-10]MDF9827204.1 hypothetical protein [Ereboglobus sp. PH5-10]
MPLPKKTRTTRRDFLKGTAAATGLFMLPVAALRGGSSGKTKLETDIPMQPDADVVVVGGGVAGVCAAVTAARQGAKTLILERSGLLGGMLTAGHVNPILGTVSKGTIYDEIVSRLTAENETEIETTRNGREVYIDVEKAKTLMFNFVAENNVECWMQSLVVDVVRDSGGDTINRLLVGTPEGIKTVSGKIIIDATGDGQVAMLAGADYGMGRDSDGRVQPVTLEFTLSNVDESRAITAWGGSDPVKLPSGQRYSEFCKEANARGELPENVAIVRLHRTARKGERHVNATQKNYINSLKPVDIFTAMHDLRNQIDQCVRFLKKYIPGYENCILKTSGSALGVRETRRVTGQYILSDNDVEVGSKFDDAVVHNAWFLIDIHNPSGGGQAEGRSKIAKPYDIPLRCLIPPKVGNLLIAGRCISGTHRAHASYRVMGICMAIGQAAGTAASLCVKGNARPDELSSAKVRAALKAQGVSLSS